MLGYHSLPGEVRAQLARVVTAWCGVLGDSLVGAYLHGSIVLNSFTPGVSDIDLLVISHRRMDRQLRLEAARIMIELDNQPSPLELSALLDSDIKPWKYPTPCQFHYSGAWSEKYAQMLRGEIRDHFILDEDFEDRDIGCHATLTRQRGIALCGLPIVDVFPEVPRADFLDSLKYDYDGLSLDAYGAQYLDSNIIGFARILSYLELNRIVSKHEAASWALTWLPEEYKALFRNAMESRFEGRAMPEIDRAIAEGYVAYMRGRIDAAFAA